MDRQGLVTQINDHTEEPKVSEQQFKDLTSFLSKLHLDELEAEHFVGNFEYDKSVWAKIETAIGHKDSLIAETRRYCVGFQRKLVHATLSLRDKNLSLLVPEVRPLYKTQVEYKSHAECMAVLDRIRSTLESARSYCRPLSA